MNVECPACQYDNQDLGDILPDKSCDDMVYRCEDCDHEFIIGWTAEVEIRDSKMPKKGLSK